MSTGYYPELGLNSKTKQKKKKQLAENTLESELNPDILKAEKSLTNALGKSFHQDGTYQQLIEAM